MEVSDSKTVSYQAAGGVVVDGDRVLVLRRLSRGEVRLPKGHIEVEEAPHAAALREVSEESGYADLEIVADLGLQVVEFDWDGRHYIREEHYFLMRLRSERHAVRDRHDERQFIPAWVTWTEAIALLTFEAEREWVRRGQQIGSG
ncbi:MAG: NUDIX domain-containing protein [Anaerolineae bacterium]|nr:NUDIX domain-containing protein [Anaerolineae bacterium]MDH7472888.1 NUDIX domain-containing protein [Anaerolineae bacterium]